MLKNVLFYFHLKVFFIAKLWLYNLMIFLFHVNVPFKERKPELIPINLAF